MYNFNNFFEYDETSPSCLRWKVGRSCGNPAGTKTKDGYWRVCLNYRRYLCHRIVWEMFNGVIEDSWTEVCIDHINGDGLDNKKGNLRLVPNKVNRRNVAKRQANKTGVTGVYRHCALGKYFYYQVGWHEEDGTSKAKTFSVLKYGEDIAKEKAICFRGEILKRRNSEGAGYTGRHGV